VVDDGQGHQISTFSADRVKAIVNQAVADAIGKEVAPLKQEQATQKAEREAHATTARINHTADAMMDRAKAWHGFTEHATAVADVWDARPDWSLQDAYLHVLHTTILPGLSKTERTKVLADLNQKPAATTVNPSSSTTSASKPDSDKSWEDYPLFVTLSVNKGDKFGQFKEEDYANRLVMAVDQERRALVMFENDLKQGFEVQLMRRSIDFDYIGRRTDELLGRLGGRTPFFALYIDCAGRASAYCGTEREEAAEVQRVIGSRVPLLGIYAGVEIAKVGGDIQALDWTGVLCMFSE